MGHCIRRGSGRRPLSEACEEGVHDLGTPRAQDIPENAQCVHGKWWFYYNLEEETKKLTDIAEKLLNHPQILDGKPNGKSEYLQIEMFKAAY